MYNTTYICTYNKPDIFLKEEELFLEDKDKDDIRDELYRHDLLNILSLEEYDDALVDTAIINLYERVKCCESLINCMTKLAAKFLSEDKLFGLIIMHSFCYLESSYKCISEFLEFGKISIENMEDLIKLINLN